jgi:hypothetical protein
MRLFVIVLLTIMVLVTGFIGLRLWQWSRTLPKASTEIVQLTPDKRLVLQRLRAEHKFQPHDFPPLGYTGAESPEDEATATQIVNGVIDTVLTRPDGPLAAKTVSDRIGKGMHEVKFLATEDRERTLGYMVEIWYRLGFKGATGRFAYGSAFPVPPGYSEPLPPGWRSPTAPRPITPPPSASSGSSQSWRE